MYMGRSRRTGSKSSSASSSDTSSPLYETCVPWARQTDSYSSSSARCAISTDSVMRRLLSNPNASFKNLPPSPLQIGLFDQRHLLPARFGKAARLQQFDHNAAVKQLVDRALDSRDKC